MQFALPKIGSLQLDNPVILAPMAGITNLPYRRVMKQFGAALVHTEMVSANGLIRDGHKTRELLASSPDEAPLAIQLFGDDTEVVTQAVELVKDDGALIDINMGCPVKKVVRSGAGSALLKNPDRIGTMIRSVRKIYPGPLTIKIRSGWDQDSINHLEVGRIAENEGVDAITLHPRTRSQGFSGQADWQHIRELKQNLKIPVFGSGDIFTATDALNMIKKTDCDGVMIGRGGYGNPWLIRDILLLLAGRPPQQPDAEERFQVAVRHMDLHVAEFGERKALLELRKHLCWYARGLAGSSSFRASLQKVPDYKELKILAREFFLENHQNNA